MLYLWIDESSQTALVLDREKLNKAIDVSAGLLVGGEFNLPCLTRFALEELLTLTETSYEKMVESMKSLNIFGFDCFHRS